VIARIRDWALAAVAGLACGLVGWTTALAAEPTFPALTGRVVDQANLLSPAAEQRLTTKLQALETETTDQLVVVTLNSLQDHEIEDFGYRLGRAWGIGQQGKNNGVLLIVAPNERRVRVEVGYGLEPILTDAFSSQVINGQILPAFKQGAFERGIEQGVDALAAQMRLDPAEAEQRARAASEAEADDVPMPLAHGAIIAIVFLFIALSLVSRAGRGGRRRRGSSVAPIVIWAASEAMRNSGRRGGGFGGGGFGGGGFGGGGGGFGGGGASGGW
jgi:uncharacterized protein